MGRTASATLKLRGDKTGLKCDVDPPDTAAARAPVEAVKRGDINQCSFAFRTLDDDWSEDLDGGMPTRTVKKSRSTMVMSLRWPTHRTTRGECSRDGSGSGRESEAPR
jgi:HK97 family phage prohead protease